MTGFGFGPTRFAAFATRRPRRVLAVWGVLVLLSLGLVGALLGSGLTSEETLTNDPDCMSRLRGTRGGPEGEAALASSHQSGRDGGRMTSVLSIAPRTACLSGRHLGRTQALG